MPKLQFVGLLCFLASMPLDVLNGDNKGYLADPNHFQGWKVVWLAFMFSSWIFRGDGHSMILGFPLAMTSALAVALPFFNLLRPENWFKSSRWLSVVGLANLVATAYFAHWAYHEGAFFGAILWLVGPALVFVGAFGQTHRTNP